MENELIYSIRLDGADENIKTLVEQKRVLAELGKETAKIKNEQKQLDNALKNGEITQEQYNEAVKLNITQQVQVESNTKKVREAMRLQEATVMANVKATDKATGSINQLSAQLSKAKNDYKNLSTEERNSAKGQELLKHIQDLDAEYKELHVSIGNTQVMVGSYKDAVNSLLPVMGGLGSQIQSVIGTLGGIKEAFSKFGAVAGASQRTVIKGFGSVSTSSADAGDSITNSMAGATASTAEYTTAQQISNATTNEGRAVVTGFSRAQQGQTATTIASSRAMQGQATATRAMSVATAQGSNALKIFKIALISTGVGAIVVALGSLIAAFASTQRGSDAISKALRPLKEIFATLVGFLQTKALAIFDRLKEAIDNPKKAFSDLLDFIKTNVINRFKGIAKFFEGWTETYVNTFKAFGLKLKRVLNDVPLIGAGLDKEALKQLDKDIEDTVKKVEAGAMKIANGLGQFTTGIEDPVTKAVKLAKQAGKAMDESAKRSEQIEKLRVAIRKSEMTYKLNMAQNNLLAEKMKFILEDETKTMAERNKAGKEYLRLITESGKREIDITNMKVKLMLLEEEANYKSDEQKQERYDLEAESMEKLAGLTGRQIEVRNKLNAMEKEAVTKQAEAQKKLAEDKAKADEEARKLAEENAKTEIERSKAVAEQKIRDLEFEQKKEKLLFAGTKAEEFEMERKHKENMFKLSLDLAQKERDLNVSLIKEQIKNEELAKKDTTKLKAELQVLENEKFLDLNRDYQLSILENEATQNEYLAESRKKAQEDQATALKAERLALNNSITQNAEKLQGTLFTNEKNRIERTTKREIEALTLRRQAGEITAEEFEKKRLEIDKKAFERKKKMDTREVILNGIVAISKIFTSRVGIAGIPEAIAMAAQTATQVAQIQSQKFRFGGNVGGKSHSQGGTMIEAEKGEAIIMKEAVNPVTAPILSAINQSYGGAPIEALNSFRGGPSAPTQMQTQTIEVVNVATDTNKIANRVKNLQNSRRF